MNITRNINLNTQLKLCDEWMVFPCCASHVKPASPTVWERNNGIVERIEIKSKVIGIPFSAKFGGATGIFNAHHVAFPKINWIKWANELSVPWE